MTSHLKILVLLASMLFLVTSLYFTRSKTSRPVYTLLWTSLSLFILSIALFDGFYKTIAQSIFGFDSAATFIIVGVLTFLLLYILDLTNKLNKNSDMLQVILSKSAILEKRVRDMENRQ